MENYTAEKNSRGLILSSELKTIEKKVIKLKQRKIFIFISEKVSAIIKLKVNRSYTSIH
jgi:hypothetical protein